MAVQTTWCLAWVSAVLVLVAVKPFQTQRCSSEKMENSTINITAAFSKGIRGTDPIYAPSWEVCVETCCSERITGDKTCNYAIFNTKMTGSSPNCYRFYFPAQEACPLKPGLGLVTYRIIEGKKMPQPAPSLNKVPHSTVNGTAAGFARPLGGPDPLPKTSKKEEEIFGPSNHSLEKVGGSSQEDPKAGRTNGVETLGSSMVHESNSPATTIQRQLLVGDAAIFNPPSHAATSAPYARNTEGPTLQPSQAPLPKPSFPSQTDPHRFSSLSSALPTPPASLRGGHLTDGQLSLEGFSPDGSPATNDFLLFFNQSFLYAALISGVLFFVIAVVLTGKRFCSQKPQGYTRLDLINGIYANM
ncbi:MANSC domain-containing protein 1 [Thamnophis elegans]|uniref:MANSC domain-containing protein 1 n=1 Tax=Thamnophis elegans TaxID=35005 RepID=UPI00137786B6|nr:MANSC domain-containing protein 1 [Thamnophis elegans]